MKILLALLLTSFGSAIAAFSQTTSHDTSFQSWNEVQFILPLVRSTDPKGKSVDKLTATFGEILRFGRSGPDLVDQRHGVILDYQVNKHLSLLSGVLYRKDEVVKNRPHIETRFSFGATLSKTFHEFIFRDRNMYEHRYRRGRVDTDIYRQRFQISRPVKHNNKAIFSPFIADEAFFDIHSGELNNNELYVGISRVLNLRTAIDIAYIRNDTPIHDVNGLSISLKIRLR